MTDNQIIDLFWNRNEDAIAATDAAYGRKLRGLSGRILQNPEDAEEIISDTYMKTWNSIPKARPQYFYAYIAAICRHLSLNLLNWNQAAKRRAEIISITEELEQCIPDPGQERSAESREISFFFMVDIPFFGYYMDSVRIASRTNTPWFNSRIRLDMRYAICRSWVISK